MTEAADLKVSMEERPAWARRLTITVPASRIEQEKRSAAQRIAKQARLPGFRKGKVPTQVMEKRFGPAIEQEAVEKAIGAAYREALTQQGLQPITQGSIENIDYEAGRDLTFNVELEVRPQIELERIGGFQLLREVAPATDAQVDEVLQRLRQENAPWRSKAEVPTAGDMASVEITPLDDATEAAPSKPRQYQIVIGEGQAVAEIEDVLRTLRAGEEGEFTVELPDGDAETPGARKPHRMHVKMLDVQQPELPELDDEFARGLGDFEGLAQLRERVREDLGREADREAERRLRAELLSQILAANPFEVPAAMVRQYLEAMLPARPGADEQQLQELREQAWPAATEALKRMLVIERVAELEALHAQPTEVEARVAELAERLGRPLPEVTAQLRKNGRLDEIERELTEEKVFEYLKSLSTIA